MKVSPNTAIAIAAKMSAELRLEAALVRSMGRLYQTVRSTAIAVNSSAR